MAAVVKAAESYTTTDPNNLCLQSDSLASSKYQFNSLFQKKKKKYKNIVIIRSTVDMKGGDGEKISWSVNGVLSSSDMIFCVGVGDGLKYLKAGKFK